MLNKKKKGAMEEDGRGWGGGEGEKRKQNSHSK